jgi:hypothetical protein
MTEDLRKRVERLKKTNAALVTPRDRPPASVNLGPDERCHATILGRRLQENRIVKCRNVGPHVEHEGYESNGEVRRWTW